jgi:hypothetical protein
MATLLHAMAAPVIQVGFGIGLLTRRFRRVSLVLAVGMRLHPVDAGPLGQNWNTIVWPWTAAMAVSPAAVFRQGRLSARDLRFGLVSCGHAAGAVCRCPC